MEDIHQICQMNYALIIKLEKNVKITIRTSIYNSSEVKWLDESYKRKDIRIIIWSKTHEISKNIFVFSTCFYNH